MEENKLAITTCAFNRASLVQRLHQSLISQNNKRFTWYVIDNGSTDNTWEILNRIVREENGFKVVINRLDHNDRAEAQNWLRLNSEEEFQLSMDDDDVAIPETVERAYKLIGSLPDAGGYAGVAGIYLNFDRRPMFTVGRSEGDIIDANNLERRKYRLLNDKCEIYRTEINRRHLFPVVPGEINQYDDALVFDKIALEGYLIRWTNEPLAMREYREEGLSKNSLKSHLRSPVCYRMANKALYEMESFPYNLAALGRYYYYYKIKHKGSSMVDCAKDMGVSLFPMLLGAVIWWPKKIKRYGLWSVGSASRDA